MVESNYLLLFQKKIRILRRIKRETFGEHNFFMSTSEASSSHGCEKAACPTSTSANLNHAELKIYILPEKNHFFAVRVVKTYLADFRAGRPI